MTATPEAGSKVGVCTGRRRREAGTQAVKCHGADIGADLVRCFGAIGVSACDTAIPRGGRAPGQDYPQEMASIVKALLSACLAPALLMAGLWSHANIAGTAFIFTFATALSHAVLFGAPLIVMFRSKGWINLATCVVVGFVVGAVPAGFLSWPMHAAALYAAAPTDGAASVTDRILRAAPCASYVTSLIQFGAFGALSGLTFWLILRCAGLGNPMHQSPAHRRPAVYTEKEIA
jgi:hypothetical protein